MSIYDYEKNIYFEEQNHKYCTCTLKSQHSWFPWKGRHIRVAHQTTRSDTHQSRTTRSKVTTLPSCTLTKLQYNQEYYFFMTSHFSSVNRHTARSKFTMEVSLHIGNFYSTNKLQILSLFFLPKKTVTSKEIQANSLWYTMEPVSYHYSKQY